MSIVTELEIFYQDLLACFSLFKRVDESSRVRCIRDIKGYILANVELLSQDNSFGDKLDSIICDLVQEGYDEALEMYTDNDSDEEEYDSDDEEYDSDYEFEIDLQPIDFPIMCAPAA
jgi:hypothetical protein